MSLWERLLDWLPVVRHLRAEQQRRDEHVTRLDSQASEQAERIRRAVEEARSRRVERFRDVMRGDKS